MAEGRFDLALVRLLHPYERHAPPQSGSSRPTRNILILGRDAEIRFSLTRNCCCADDLWWKASDRLGLTSSGRLRSLLHR